MTYNPPVDAVGGVAALASYINGYVIGNLRWFYDGGRVRAEHTSQNISTATWTDLTWGGETYDTSSGMHSTGVNTERFIALEDGTHYLFATSGIVPHATGNRGIRIAENGATTLFMPTMAPSVGASYAHPLSVGLICHMDAGDYWTVQAYQDSGGTLATAAGVPMRATFGILKG